MVKILYYPSKKLKPITTVPSSDTNHLFMTPHVSYQDSLLGWAFLTFSLNLFTILQYNLYKTPIFIMEHVVDLNEYISESSMKMLIDAGFDTSSSTYTLTIEDPSPIHQTISSSYVCDLVYCTHEVPTYTIAELLDRIPQEYSTNVGYDDSKYTISVYHEGECLTIVQSKTLSDAVALSVYNLFTMSAMD